LLDLDGSLAVLKSAFLGESLELLISTIDTKFLFEQLLNKLSVNNKKTILKKLYLLIPI
jgi:hypothetical protein